MFPLLILLGVSVEFCVFTIEFIPCIFDSFNRTQNYVYFLTSIIPLFSPWHPSHPEIPLIIPETTHYLSIHDSIECGSSRKGFR